MMTMSDNDFRQADDFIMSQINSYGHFMDKNECRQEGWRAFMEAENSYYKVAGCCSFAVYAQYCILDTLDLLRKRRNKRIEIESRLSLDMNFEDCDETVGNRYFCAVNDYLGDVALWDFINRLGKEERQIISLLTQGYGDREIYDELHISRKEYVSLFKKIQRAVSQW